LFYLMAAESCGIYTKTPQEWTQGRSYYGGSTRRAPDDASAKFLRAIDIQTGRIAWEIPALGGGVIGSGLLSTAGGLIFFGDASGGAFVAADAGTGELLWHFDTGEPWRAGPMTFTTDGRQFIGVAAGPVILAFGLP
jgi:alcohol dehydrogenase (cytochrome c)